MYVNLYDYVVTEMLIHGELNHRNVIKLIEVIDDAERVHRSVSLSPIYMVIEFAKYGESLSWNSSTNKFHISYREKKHYDESEIRKLIKDVVSGVGYRCLKSPQPRNYPPRHQTAKHSDRRKLPGEGSRL